MIGVTHEKVRTASHDALASGVSCRRLVKLCQVLFFVIDRTVASESEALGGGGVPLGIL